MTTPFNPFKERKYQSFASPYSSFWARWQFTANYAVTRMDGILYAYPVVYGVDLSQWNADPIDFNSFYNGGWKFVIHKASEGLSYEDPTFAPRLPYMLDSGALIMAYGFTRGNQLGRGQAEQLLRVTEKFRTRVNDNTMLMSDDETLDGVSQSTRYAGIINWHNEIQVSFKPKHSIEYSSPGAWSNLTGNRTLPDGIWQDVAHWTSASNPIQPTGWNLAYRRLWQIGVYGSHPWCPQPPGWPTGKRVDVQVFFGTETDLRNWIGNQAVLPKTLHVRVVNEDDEIFEGDIPKI